MHATPPRRNTATTRPETTAGSPLSAAFRSALGAAALAPHPAGDDGRDHPGARKNGLRSEQNSKAPHPGPARSVTLAPRQGHR